MAEETMLAAWDKPLNNAFYSPDDEEKAFMKAETRIQEDEELKTHIISVQTKAFALYQYPCIRIFEFLRLKMARLPAYPRLLKLGQQRPGAILLDLGCCFGNDVRKTVQDGYPIENVIASDLHGTFWELGHEMFRSTPDTFPVHFITGDVLDPDFLSSDAPPLPTSPSPSTPLDPRLGLADVTALTDLRGQVSAIFTGAFFHLFTFEQQLHIARALAGLLSPIPGSMLFGVQGGRAVKGLWTPGQGTVVHAHSPESWSEMWEAVFAEAGAEVKVEAALRREIGGDDFFGTWPSNTEPYHVLEWSVTRS